MLGAKLVTAATTPASTAEQRCVICGAHLPVSRRPSTAKGCRGCMTQAITHCDVVQRMTAHSTRCATYDPDEARRYIDEDER